MAKFLDKKGLTSSEANHLTNIVKELVKKLDVSELDIVKSTFVFDGITYESNDIKKVDNIESRLVEIGELYSLSAWLKTAIKYKEAKINEVTNSQFIDLPRPETKSLPRYKEPTMSDYLDTLNVADRMEYLKNESIATHIGKFIHNFDKVREEFRQFKPTEIKSYNGQNILVKNELVYTEDEILETFFSLQEKHRNSEKVVNFYKAKYNDYIKDHLIAFNQVSKEIRDYNYKLESGYSKSNNEAYATFIEGVKNKKKEISELRIVVPKEMQELVNKIKGN